MLTYTYRYNRVIDWFKKHQVDSSKEYCEKHHIIPHSCGGENTKENLVLLPGKWHYIVHCWLPFVYLEKNDLVGYSKMLSAWERMTSGAKYSENKIRTYNIKRDSEQYTKLRKLANESISKKQKEHHKLYGPYAKGTFWISNPETLESKMVHSESEIPIGWKRGRISLIGKRWITNLTTNKRILIDKNEPIPEGFVVGDKTYSEEIWITDGITNTRIKKDDIIPDGWKHGRTINFSEESKLAKAQKQKITNTTTIKISNGIETLRILKEQQIPEGFQIVPKKKVKIKGNIGLKCITDGKINKMHDPKLPLPEGYKYGMTRESKHLVCFTNGKRNIYRKPSDPIPDGFIRGSWVKSAKGKMFINNGKQMRLLDKNAPIPDGWVKGVLK